jgi:hypothetical protein
MGKKKPGYGGGYVYITKACLDESGEMPQLMVDIHAESYQGQAPNVVEFDAYDGGDPTDYAPAGSNGTNTYRGNDNNPPARPFRIRARAKYLVGTTDAYEVHHDAPYAAVEDCTHMLPKGPPKSQAARKGTSSKSSAARKNRGGKSNARRR